MSLKSLTEIEKESYKFDLVKNLFLSVLLQSAKDYCRLDNLKPKTKSEKLTIENKKKYILKSLKTEEMYAYTDGANEMLYTALVSNSKQISKNIKKIYLL